MTKLEEKLLELGYTKYPLSKEVFIKQASSELWTYIWLNDDFNYVECSKIRAPYDFKTQKNIDDLQIAFNILQRDLKILKEYGGNNK